MFDTISKGFRQARNRLAGLTELTDKNIDAALREVRLSLLEADVELGVAKAFLARVKEAAVGLTVETRVKNQGETFEVGAGEQFIKICHDELIKLMRYDGDPIVHAEKGPTKIVMVGLQGSGKTTSSAKLAHLLGGEMGRKPLLVAADMQRPAAVEQLKVLGEQIDVPVFNLPGETPIAICAAAEAEARKLKCDVIIYDTAGRLSIDEALMGELSAIKEAVTPQNIYLVVDAMIGQDAVQTAKNFNEKLDITGVVMTKLDGDARGGAALSVLEVTGAPILFAGMGETLDKLEEFRAEGMASRILGMGDVVGLMQDFTKVVDEKKAEKDATRMLSGDFTLDDFLEQIDMISQMGSLKDLVDKLPLGSMMPGGLPDGVNLDDKELVKIRSVIQSMTKYEKADPYVLIREPSRTARIARGSGNAEEQVNAVVQQFMFMKQMMGSVGQDMGLMGKIPGMKGMANMRNLRRMMKKGQLPEGLPGMGAGGGFPGMPGLGGGGFPGLGGGFPGFPGMGGLPGMGGAGGGSGGESMTKSRKATSVAEKNAKKAKRRRQRTARKKGRK
ncbi:MAG: signal recognition particle protein [Myxococcota bacterium]